ISASHVAFGSTRVMATCAILGEAAGIGAALSHSLEVPPRALAEEQLPALHRALVRADASTLGIPDEDPANLALSATVGASSTRAHLASTTSTGSQVLEKDLSLVLPADPGIDGLEVLVDAAEDTELSAALHTTSKPQNYLPHAQLGTTRVPVPQGRSWVRLPFAHTPDAPRNLVVVLHSNPLLRVHRGDHAEPGTVTMHRRPLPPGEEHPEQWREWKETLHGAGICFRLLSPTSAFAATRALGGYARPYGGPNMWISGPPTEDPQPVLELAWEEPQRVTEVDLLFDDDLNEDLINLHHHRSPDDIMPTLVRNARLEAHTDGAWHHLDSVRENRERRRVLRLDAPVRATALRLVVEVTHGVTEGRVEGVRVYEGWRPARDGRRATPRSPPVAAPRAAPDTRPPPPPAPGSPRPRAWRGRSARPDPPRGRTAP